MAAVSAIWGRKFMGFGSLNTAYITLIRKKKDANQPKDFKANGEPCCLLQQMLSPNQIAFIKDHFIQDNFMLVQQTTLCWCSKQRGFSINQNSPYSLEWLCLTKFQCVYLVRCSTLSSSILSS
jgi:hypothetical protein